MAAICTLTPFEEDFVILGFCLQVFSSRTSAVI